MDPEIKAKWVAALRSGLWVQGRTFLRSKDDEYCCLGVLCDVMGCTWEPLTTHPRTPYYIKNADTEGLVALPPDIKTRSGITDQGTLMHFNDSVGFDFNRIADWIERNL